mgnify:CR=1 FL=1
MKELKEGEIGLVIMEKGELVLLGLSKENAMALNLFLSAITANEPLVKAKKP